MKQWTVQHTITAEQVANALCTAWEGGSNYWAQSEGQPYRMDDEGTVRLDLDAFPVLVFEADGDGQWSLTLDSIQRGLNAMARLSPAMFALEFGPEYEGDASTADAFLQYCLFGELVYG